MLHRVTVDLLAESDIEDATVLERWLYEMVSEMLGRDERQVTPVLTRATGLTVQAEALP